MKRLGCILCAVGFLLCAGLFVALLKGAQERQQVGGGSARVSAVVMRFDLEPNGAPKATHVTAHIQFVSMTPTGTMEAKDLAVVTFDMLQHPGERVLISGISREYRALALGVYAAAMQEWKDMSSTPPPLDEDRKTLRVK